MRVVLSCLMFLAVSAILQGADPSPDKPFEPLQKIGLTKEADELWTKAVEAESEIRKLIAQLDKGGAADPKPVAKLYSSLVELRLFDERMREFYEPAAEDFEKRREVYDLEFARLYGDFIRSPKAEAHGQNALALLNKSAKQRLAKLKDIHEMINKKKFVEAEMELDKAVDQFLLVAGILGTADRDTWSKPYDEVRDRLRTPMRDIRIQAATSAVQEEVQSLLNQVDGLFAALEVAKSSIRQNGTAEFMGQSLDGPALTSIVLNEWCRLHLGIQRANVIDRGGPKTDAGAGGDFKGGGDFKSSAKGASDVWATRADEIGKGIALAIGGIIEADAQHASTDVAGKRLDEYLQVIAPHGAKLQPVHIQSMQSALYRLTEKAGSQRSVVNYDAATSELLKWKERAALSQAKASRGAHPELPTLLRQKTTAQLNQSGLYLEGDSSRSHPSLFDSVPESMPVLDRALTDQKVRAAFPIRLDSEKPNMMTRFNDGTYCVVPATVHDPSLAASLSKELFVDETHGPLTLKAAIALTSAARGDYIEVGGTVEKLAVESAAARYASIPKSAAGLVQLGKVMQGGGSGVKNAALNVRCTIEPQWILHQYAFRKIGDSLDH